MIKTIQVNPEDSVFLRGRTEMKTVVPDDSATPGELKAAKAWMPDRNYLKYSVIRQGSSGVDVEFAQTMLFVFIRDHGNQSIDNDGYFGAVTTSFAKEFQRRSGLGQDGVIGAETWKRLSPQVSHGMSYWNRDMAIKEVQRLLKITGRYTGYIDGEFGAGTRSAVLGFQRDWGLDADGIWGRQCWGAVEQGCL